MNRPRRILGLYALTMLIAASAGGCDRKSTSSNTNAGTNAGTGTGAADPNSTSQGADVHDPLVVADDPDLLARARARAKDTWEQFAVALSEAEPGRGGYAIKKGYPYDGDGGNADLEYMWINVTKWDGTVFHGVIANMPVKTEAVEYGDQVEVRPEEIEDWMYLEGKTLRGGFTMRVLYWQDSNDEARKALDAQGIEVPPVDF